jgi:S-DNA-T family DNA segregation ATPase FtsK/SpoIIIE
MPRGKASKSKPKTKQKPKRKPLGEIAGVIFIALGIFLGICVFFQTDTGLLGGVVKNVLLGLFGIFAYLIPFALIILGIMVIAARKKTVNKCKVLLIALFFVSVLSLTHTFALERIDMQSGFFAYVAGSYRLGAQSIAGAGAIGCLIVYPIHLLIGHIGCIILFITSGLISIIVLANLSIRKMGENVASFSKKTVEKARENVARRKDNRLYIENLGEDVFEDQEPAGEPEILGQKSFRKKKRPNYFDDEVYAPEDVIKKAEEIPLPSDADAPDDTGGLTIESYESYQHEQARDHRDDMEETVAHAAPKKSKTAYTPPPMTLLTRPEAKSKNAGMEEQRRNALLIEETLGNFGVDAKVVHIVKGPAVTRYELRPAPGVRVKRIKELENDLAMNLAAKAVKIEAPIPGKAAVGVEVPNSDVTFVHLRSLLDTEEFRKAKSPLTFALGKDISGKNYFVDITKMPHILIAGETGSGKSVCINSLITSILYKATPDDVKMILIDPKVVELSVFKNIPHLLVPVVTDPKKAASALHWAVSEMTTRYKLFAEHGARNVSRYNEIMSEEERLPRLVVIIDELAELMMATPREVEDAICRIAQLGRAAGIHLVVATQRPSVNVITGVIKANISSRIAFKVNSGVDSRTILDQHGAEKLLRNGDMLYHPSDAPKTVRLQGCFVSDTDIESVTEYISGGNEAEFDENIVADIASPESEAPEDDDYDELFPKAVEIVLEYGQASISMLQRRLRVGYARAARLVDEMEVRSIVSPFEGSKARQVLITWDAYEEMFGPRGA